MKTKEEKASAIRKWRAEHPEQWAEIQRRSREKNLERIRERDRLRRPRSRTAYPDLPENVRRSRCDYQRAYVARNPQAQIAHSCSMRAKASGIPRDLRFLRTLPCPTHCPVLGTPISFAYGKGKRPAENTASFDQIRPGAGYVPGNVQIISLLANQMKSTATPEQLLKFADWIHTQFGHDSTQIWYTEKMRNLKDDYDGLCRQLPTNPAS